MFYHLIPSLSEYHIVFNVFRYVTFRAVAAFITALLFSFVLGPRIIRMLQGLQAVEHIDSDTPAHHKSKQGTPTMGGLIILAGLLFSSLLWNNMANNFVLCMYLTVLWLGGLGFLDDYLKNIRRFKKGLVARYKLFGQLTVSLIIVLILYMGSPDKAAISSICVPFFKNFYIHLGLLFIPFVLIYITGFSNAVNLTDGLDGLAGGTVAICGIAMGIMAYIKGHAGIAGYLQIEYIAGAEELVIFTSAMIGTVLGFLWFNTKPAEIFMGDTGSLTLGGILAVEAILLREQIFLLIVGGIFVVEALSSLMQRYYFKYTRRKYGTGRRIFRCAPLHHHFELKGMAESKIVVRFWIVATLLAAVGLATIKLR
ncbi:MAG: phospho-N-acetylmuramoyl-pentapeptide-transferase [Candidatus Cloacimonetes bacterium]|nr:phospho-N-acetylmuramoyl-pentapeptide-transferase [Candidatus Cloacimonadota bacterium]